MLNYFLTYCICMSVFMLVWYEGKVIVPGLEDGICRGVGKFFVSFFARAWILSFVLFFGMCNGGLLGPGYGTWWETYTADHSMLIWTLTTPVITGVLWFVWHSTALSMSKPGSVGWWEPGTAPSLHRISMRLPAMWGLVFYSWLLFSPTLPFYRCYVRLWVMRAPFAAIF
jgi:hypothetical protein